MPLSISLDALLLKKAVGYPICRIAFANQLVLYAAVCSSLFHLTVIAWERYVAIQKWNYYKVIVTRQRVKKCAGIAWLLAVLTTTPARILTALGVDFKYIKILDLILTLPAVVCIVLIGYFYIMVFLGVRKQRAKDICEGHVRAEAKMERNIANTTGILTVTLLISYIPSIIVLILGGSVPFLRTSSFFRWSELLTQLNSLANPLLYCFVLNCHFRREILKLLKTKNPERIQPRTGLPKRRTRRINVANTVECSQDFEDGQRHDRFEMLGFPGDAGTGKSRQVVDDEDSSSSSRIANRHVICVDVHQPKSSKFRPNIAVTNNAMKREGQTERKLSGLSRCSQYQVRHHESCNEVDVIEMDFVAKKQTVKGKTTQRPTKTSLPSPNSTQAKPTRWKPEIKVTNGVMNRGGQT